jgi:hypothetical protein
MKQKENQAKVKKDLNSLLKPNKGLKDTTKTVNADAKGLVQASAGHDCC